MFRTNSVRDVSATGMVRIDAGGGVVFEAPVVPTAEVYDSGLRDIAGTLLADWRPYSPGQHIGARILRVGNAVTLALDLYWDGATLNELSVGDATTFAHVLPIPEGFLPIGSGFIAPAKVSNNPVEDNPVGIGKRASGWWDSVSGNLRVRDFNRSVATCARFTNVVTWTTLDAPPATLPGVPA